MSAGSVAQFLDNPSLEAIRALLVINTHYVFLDSGEHTGSGMGLLSLAVQIALSLGLHRDPDKTPGKFDAVQTEERRRLFWTLCSFECLASSALGRSFSIFNLEQVDTKVGRLPLPIGSAQGADGDVGRYHSSRAIWTTTR